MRIDKRGHEQERFVVRLLKKFLFWPGHGKRLESRLGPEERGGLIRCVSPGAIHHSAFTRLSQKRRCSYA
jgi:hypothetical protein